MCASQATLAVRRFTQPRDAIWLGFGLVLAALAVSDATSAQAPHLSIDEPTRAGYDRVVYSPDGRLIAGIGLQPTGHSVQLWEATTGRPIVTLPIRKDCRRTQLLAFTPDGKELVAGGMGFGANLPGAAAWGAGAIEVFDVKTGRRRHTFVLAEGRAGDAVVAPDNKTLIIARLTAPAALYDLTTGKELAVLKDHDKVRSVALSGDGKRLATGSFDGTVCVWDLAKRQRLRKFDAQETREMACIALTPDGKGLAAATNATNRLLIWDVGTGQRQREFPLTKLMGGRATGLTYTADGATLIIGGSTLVSVLLLDVKANKFREFPPPPWEPIGTGVGNVSLSPDGKFVAGAGSRNRVYVWEVKAAQPFDWQARVRREDKRFEERRDQVGQRHR